MLIYHISAAISGFSIPFTQQTFLLSTYHVPRIGIWGAAKSLLLVLAFWGSGVRGRDRRQSYGPPLWTMSSCRRCSEEKCDREMRWGCYARGPLCWSDISVGTLMKWGESQRAAGGYLGEECGCHQTASTRLPCWEREKERERPREREIALLTQSRTSKKGSVPQVKQPS